MEAEVIALAHCCHELFLIVDVVTELVNVMGLETKDLVPIPVSIHEDNAGPLVWVETIPPEFNPHSSSMQSHLVGFMKKSRSMTSSY